MPVSSSAALGLTEAPWTNAELSVINALIQTKIRGFKDSK
jgi:hypothetical protein